MNAQSRWQLVRSLSALWLLALLLVPAALLLPQSACAAPADSAAAKLAKLASQHYKKGAFAEGAKLFHQAWQLEKAPVHLFNAARCEQRAFDFDAAERDYDALLILPDLPAAMAQRARTHLQEVRDLRARFGAEQKAKEIAENKQVSTTPPQPEKLEGGSSAAPPAAEPPAKPTPLAQAEGVLSVAPPPERSDAGRLGAWTALGLGAAAALGGGALWALAEVDQRDLNDLTSQRDSAGQIAGLTYGDYRARQVDINDRRQQWQIAALSGAAVAGTGALLLWLWRDEPQPAKLAPAVADGNVGWVLRF